MIFCNFIMPSETTKLNHSIPNELELKLNVTDKK